MTDLYLVDDHALLREGLTAVLKAAGHHVVGESGDPTVALADIQRLVPQVVLLDLHLGLRSGFELLSELQRRSISVRTLVLTMSVHPRHVAEDGGFVPQPADGQDRRRRRAGAGVLRDPRRLDRRWRALMAARRDCPRSGAASKSAIGLGSESLAESWNDRSVPARRIR